MALIVFGVCGLQAQTTGHPWRGAPGITETVEQIMARERGAAAPIGPPRPTKREPEANRSPRANPDAPEVAQWPAGVPTEQSAVPAEPAQPQTVGVSFLAAQLSESGYIPPDCNGAVSDSQIVTIVNGRIKVFTRTGVLGSLNVSTNTFFTSVRNGSTTSDPHVRYDRTSGRWFLVMINVAAGSNRVLLAVSNGSVISNASSFTFYQFAHDQVGTTPNHDSGQFADYPTLAVDASALYIGVNVFNVAGDSVKGTTAFVIRKSDLLVGTLTVTAFRALTDGTTAGPWTPQGADNDDPAAAEGYFVGVDFLEFSLLDVRRITDPGGTPSISADLAITVPATYFPIRQVHAGASSNRRLDAIDDRLFAAQIKKNSLTGISSLWTAHNIRVTLNGVAATNGNRNASRWYELRNLSTTPVLSQSGTLFDPAASNPRGFWIPTVAASGQGHVALGCSYASSVDFAGVAIAGRLSGDAAGTTRPATLAVVSSTSYNVEATDGQRWGDFSQVVIDPADNMTMWTFQEYCNATNSWGMRVLKLLAPPPATPATASPDSAEVGIANLTVTVTGTVSGGSAFFDPGLGFSRHLSATVNGGGVTVNSVTFMDSAHLSMNISVAANAPPGPRTLTVVNPDGQSLMSVPGILTLTNANCPAITLAPDTLFPGVAGFSYNQLITAAGGISPYTYAVTSGTLPAGVTLSAAGLLSGTPVFGGTYGFTITATDSALCPGSHAYSWLVTGCPQITVAPASLPDGIFGSAYSQTLASSGGVAPYTYGVTIGTLPTGLSLAASGSITGTPSALGTWNFTVTSTDAGACTGNRAYAITIAPAAGSNTILLTVLDSTYTQNFNTLALSGSSSSLPTGWLLSETGTNANSLYAATDGTANTGDTYSFGTTGNAERAYGGLQSGSLTPTFGAVFSNLTGSTIASLEINYTGEQWRLGANGRTDRIDFQLSTNATSLTSGTWVNDDSLDFTAPDTGGAIGPMNGNAHQVPRSHTISGLTVPNGGTIYLRWLDFNASTADDGLAVDDFSLTPHGILVPTDPSGAGLALPETLRVGEASLLTVSVTPGTNPTSSGLAVSADLSSVDGLPAQQFYDNGTHGDASAGDHLFSYRDTIPLSAAPGAKSLPVEIIDAQSRLGAATIDVVLQPTCPAITLTAPPLPGGEVGVTYSLQLTAAGGTPPYTYAVTAGTLPPGVSLSAGGLLSGMPLASDTFAFTVTALDSGGCPGTQPYQLGVIQGDQIAVRFPSTGFWNLISNPVLPANDSVDVLFPEAVSSAFAYVPGSGYELSSRLVNGLGYWLKFPLAETLHIVGAVVPAETVAVAEGWNLFGSITAPVAGAALGLIGTSITSDLYAYANGYQVVDTVRPARGHWAKFSTAGELVMGGGALAAPGRRGEPEATDLAFSFTDSRGRSQQLLLLPRDANLEVLGRYELPPVPPDGSFDVRFATERRAERSPSARGSFLIALRDAVSPLTLRWSRSAAGGRKFSLSFGAGGDGAVLLDGASGEASIRCDSVAATATLSVEGEATPSAFALYQNFPNPFNPATLISFGLPEASRVTLSVVSVLGVNVATLLSNAPLEAGVHEIRFDASSLASGIYYCRVTAFPNGTGQVFTATRKMLLVR